MKVLARVLLSLTALAFAGVMAAVALFLGLYLYYSPTLPAADSLRDVRLQTPMRVYTADGLLMAEFAEQRREPVGLADIPEPLIQAFLAAEDERFYRHRGVDPIGLVRAGINLFTTGERTQGGSTITMQLARNFFLTRERTYERKIREILLAVEIERTLSKDEILELYLNKIYLGQRAYGVAAAAQVYFGLGLGELDLDQIAIIAGLPKAPSTTNPVTSPERAENRRNYVLRRMLDLGFISSEEHAAALAQPVISKLHTIPAEAEAHWVSETARQIAVNLWGEAAYTRGLQIYTTIEAPLQEAANAALREGLIAYDRRHGYRGPEAHLDDAIRADADARTSALRSLGASGNMLHPAVVLEVREAGILLDAGALGEIELDNEALTLFTRDPKRAEKPLQPGDVVRIQPLDEGGWQLAQRPEAAGALIAQSPDDGAILALAGGIRLLREQFRPGVAGPAAARVRLQVADLRDRPAAGHDSGQHPGGCAPGVQRPGARRRVATRELFPQFRWRHHHARSPRQLPQPRLDSIAEQPGCGNGAPGTGAVRPESGTASKESVDGPGHRHADPDRTEQRLRALRQWRPADDTLADRAYRGWRRPPAVPGGYTPHLPGSLCTACRPAP
jgi:penicillin-binding protein 1A